MPDPRADRERLNKIAQSYGQDDDAARRQQQAVDDERAELDELRPKSNGRPAQRNWELKERNFNLG